MSNDTPGIAEATAVAAIAQKAAIIADENGTEYLIVPNTCSQIPLSKGRETPVRARIGLTLRNTLQLHAYLLANQDLDHRPVVFADQSIRRFTAYLDYHKPATPSWLDHVASVQMTLSKQAKLWIGKQDDKFTQDELADFLEDNDSDLLTQEMHSVAANFQAVRTETFRSSRRKENGDFELTHSAQTAAGGDKIITVPPQFEIAVPLWEGDTSLTKLRLNLRHRVGEKGVTFSYKIHQLDRIIDATWEDEVKRLETAIGTGAELYQGSAPVADPV